jgi:replicative DNA helicase
MVELQIINKILAQKSVAIIKNNSLTEEHFMAYKRQFKFIMNHYMAYGNVPDVPTFLMEFQEFQLLDVAESEKFLVEQLFEQFIYSKIVPVINTIADKVRSNAIDAVSYTKAEIEKISQLSIGFREGYDIVANADERKNEFEFRANRGGILGISSGIAELDAITHGWMSEDLIMIVGRTNEGKSWVMLYFLVKAWMEGKKILLYSGEMSKTTVGFRFDTLTQNFSNEALMQGLENLGTSEEAISREQYFQFISDLKEGKISNAPFVVVTPKDLGGERLDIPKLQALIEKHKPDIVGIDQLSLMADYRANRGEHERIKFTHIAEDLYLVSERYGIPIIAPAQASRESVKQKAKGESSEAPELHQIAESDGVGQNATRVIGIKQIGSTMKLSIKKNRYGKNNQELLMMWDIDRGIVKPFLQVDGFTGRAELTQGNNGSDLF